MQVTNPPLDPLLERHGALLLQERQWAYQLRVRRCSHRISPPSAVFSLNITFGRKGSFLREDQHASFLVRLPSPVVSELQVRRSRRGGEGRTAAFHSLSPPPRVQLHWLLSHRQFPSKTLPATWAIKDGPGGLEAGVVALCLAAEAAVDAGSTYLLLSDRGVDAAHAPIPMLLAVGAVHTHLIRAGKRMSASLLVETAEAREDHHVAALIGFGASLVHPYLAYETVAEIALARQRAGEAGAPSVEDALANYRTALQDGLLR